MGRPASSRSGRITLDIDPQLKVRASIAAIRRQVTLTALIEAAIREYLKRPAEDAERDD